MNLLEWENMKCFHHIIKKTPELFAQLVAGLYKKDHESKEACKPDEQYWHNMYTVYDTFSMTVLTASHGSCPSFPIGENENSLPIMEPNKLLWSFCSNRILNFSIHCLSFSSFTSPFSSAGQKCALSYTVYMLCQYCSSGLELS